MDWIICISDPSKSEGSRFRSCQDLGTPIFPPSNKVVEKAEHFFRSYRDDEKDANTIATSNS
jgi:hypothetical protein